jgi:hypothetical protein
MFHAHFENVRPTTISCGANVTIEGVTERQPVAEWVNAVENFKPLVGMPDAEEGVRVVASALAPEFARSFILPACLSRRPRGGRSSKG